MEVDVDRESGRIDVVRVVAAVDSGDVVNPDGIRNQIEGGIVQSLSWSLYESVAFDDTRITSRDWSSYPIMRFASVPQKHRRSHHRSARHALSRHGRGGAGTRRGRACQRAGQRRPARGSGNCR